MIDRERDDEKLMVEMLLMLMKSCLSPQRMFLRLLDNRIQLLLRQGSHGQRQGIFLPHLSGARKPRDPRTCLPQKV